MSQIWGYPLVKTYGIWDSKLGRLVGRVYISKKDAAMNIEKNQSVIEVIRKPNAPLLKKEDILPGKNIYDS